jgi:O-acetyl-ADP-ribose deacetylase
MSTILREQRLPGGQLLQLVHGDLTEEQVEAIVNAANSRLQHGGGVAGAIVRKGGPQIQQESDAWVRQHGPVSHSSPAYTAAGSLPCRYILHAVGPIWGESSPEEADAHLEAAVKGSLLLAGALQLTALALPAISTGIFGFPKERAAGVIYQSIQDYFSTVSGSTLQLVRIAILDQPTLAVFQQVWDTLFAPC